MVNYGNGKIYKIQKIGGSDEIYIGSTTKQYLSQRMDTHRKDYKRWKDGKRNFVSSFTIFEKYGIDNCEIILVENVNCNTKDELHKKEAEYIKLNTNSVNRSIPGRDRKQWVADNKEYIRERQANYEKIHKDEIKLKKQKYYILVKADKEQRITCECGCQVAKCRMITHKKSLKHNNLVKMK